MGAVTVTMTLVIPSKASGGTPETHGILLITYFIP